MQSGRFFPIRSQTSPRRMVKSLGACAAARAAEPPNTFQPFRGRRGNFALTIPALVIRMPSRVVQMVGPGLDGGVLNPPLLCFFRHRCPAPSGFVRAEKKSVRSFILLRSAKLEIIYPCSVIHIGGARRKIIVFKKKFFVRSSIQLRAAYFVSAHAIADSARRAVS